MDEILVIGEKSGKELRRLEQAITTDELFQSAKTTHINKLHLGQYLTSSEISLLRKFCNEKGIDCFLDKNSYPNADNKITHKHQYSNSLITKPTELAHRKYQSDIWISGENEFIQDHTTGYHVQGMILIEAVRQMFISVSEIYYSREWCKNAYVIIHKLNTNFISFTFPLQIIIQQNILDIKEKNKSIFFDSEFSVIQGNNVTFTAKATYSIHEKSILIEKEKSKAQNLINSTFQGGK